MDKLINNSGAFQIASADGVSWSIEQLNGCVLPPGSEMLPFSELVCKLHPLGIYLCICREESARLSERGTMQRKARIFMNNRSQAVRLPKEFQFSTQEVFIRKEGSEVVLSPRPYDWSSYLAEGPVASATFMEGIEDLPVQEREP